MEPSFGADRLLVEGEAARFLDDAIGVLVAKLRAQIPWSAVKDEISGGVGVRIPGRIGVRSVDNWQHG